MIQGNTIVTVTSTPPITTKTKIVDYGAADMTPMTTTTFKFSCFSQQMTHHLEALLIVDYDLLKVWLKLFLVDFQRGSSV